jgi:hypothetical protein
VLVRLRSPAVEPAPAPIPLGLDPDALSDGGSFDAIVVRGMPEGAILSAGTYDPAIAGWVLLPHQLPDLTLTPAKAPRPDFTLSLLGISLKPGDRARPRVLARVPVAIG